MVSVSVGDNCIVEAVLFAHTLGVLDLLRAFVETQVVFHVCDLFQILVQGFVVVLVVRVFYVLLCHTLFNNY